MSIRTLLHCGFSARGGTWGPRGAWAAAVLALSCWATGCETTTEKPSSQAYVIIENRSADEVQSAVLDVFEANFYKAVYSRPGRMVFEKGGSTMEEMAYGSWLQGETVVRVEVTIQPHQGVSHLVEANGHVIRAAGSYFEEETPQLLQRRARYQKLLDEVAKRL